MKLSVDQRRSAVYKMSMQKMRLKDIAAKLEVTPRTVSRDRIVLGLTKPTYPSLTDKQWAVARAMLDDGCSYAEVGRSMGVAPTTISGKIPGKGWTSNEAGSWGLYLRKLRDNESI